MTKVLNLDDINRDNPFSFDNLTPKQTATGLRFNTYRGLRMYLITGSKDTAWLHAKYPHDFTPLYQKEAPWVYIKDLREILLESLKRDIASRRLIGLVANRKTQVVTNDTSELGQMWHSVVSEVVKGL
uniref:Uncharacterized protein n=1 Tax=Pseudomonas phage RVTF4 TaxID=3236931 RepID=A0AB39CDD1_9VIRU